MEALNWAEKLFRDNLPEFHSALPTVEAVFEVERCRIRLRSSEEILCDIINDAPR
jgi:hypothetical protein